MIADPYLLAVALVGAHCLFDYAGQGDFMSNAKNPAKPIPGVPWYTVMAGHGAIHGAAVALLTGIWWLFLAEATLHCATDYVKCRGRLSFNADQVLHLTHKAVWWIIAVWIVA